MRIGRDQRDAFLVGDLAPALDHDTAVGTDAVQQYDQRCRLRGAIRKIEVSRARVVVVVEIDFLEVSGGGERSAEHDRPSELPRWHHGCVPASRKRGSVGSLLFFKNSQAAAFTLSLIT